MASKLFTSLQVGVGLVPGRCFSPLNESRDFFSNGGFFDDVHASSFRLLRKLPERRLREERDGLVTLERRRRRAMIDANVVDVLRLGVDGLQRRLLEHRPLSGASVVVRTLGLLDEVLLVLAQHEAVLHLVAGGDVVQVLEILHHEQVVRQVHVGDAFLGVDGQLGLLEIDDVVVDEGPLVAEQRHRRQDVVLIRERVLPLEGVVIGRYVDAVADAEADAVLEAGFGGRLLRLSSSFSSSEVPSMEVDEDHDEAAEDDGGRAEVVARSAAEAGVDVA